MQRTTTGFSILNLIKLVEKEKGPEGKHLLEIKNGSLQYYSFRKYPLEEKMKLQKYVCEIMFGDSSEESFFRLGKKMFGTYINSIAGKTIMALLATDVKKAVMGIPKAVSIIQKEEGFDFQVQDLGGNHVKAIVKNSPLSVGYLGGIFASGVEYFKCKANIKWNIISEENYEYDVTWEECS
ncbi:hypothetical protein A2X44_05325 [candidate division CPR3 bacterium GWF2_35_18]|uniref:4-vinyl reductase 4VR domain-containing protein n=1 Tax=candidate division CPR3 bacterium GW2011_GWF2_35_18 TaxID=1618350 RepID=A0A0G0BI12_UNCC3|nr:MAG: hypothetical protein UR67_C0009G0011 [candidate division CPR3 bacterium GW2011_GWF2_35_18]OGB63820.1 MAG: hypothetical protein A2X44_05325 [candidate division CPR3 bacterium GWF2_35_18]OGB65207.1 MAG: hypothetical protein A2250_03075 [candidate division CPR3 bacterium RIFOXYA2_FULL_35_13]OGB77217.1 MAG: hypothetical protein A2476_00840 [candidate division CPR3 bacterium RIFOXYC2_FULL_35_7]OGB79410.1 MAG: hypothetical protein A2296_04780 [candidate division CPR3 bacterium RIFOXYB2_FULL_3